MNLSTFMVFCYWIVFIYPEIGHFLNFLVDFDLIQTMQLSFYKMLIKITINQLNLFNDYNQQQQVTTIRCLILFFFIKNSYHDNTIDINMDHWITLKRWRFQFLIIISCVIFSPPEFVIRIFSFRILRIILIMERIIFIILFGIISFSLVNFSYFPEKKDWPLTLSIFCGHLLRKHFLDQYDYHHHFSSYYSASWNLMIIIIES